MEDIDFPFLESGDLTYLHCQNQCPMIIYAQAQADDLPKPFRIIGQPILQWLERVTLETGIHVRQSPIRDRGEKTTSWFGGIAEQKLQLYSLCFLRLFFFFFPW